MAATIREFAKRDRRNVKGMFWIVVGITGCVLPLWNIVNASR